MFRRLHEPKTVGITVDGVPLRAAVGDTVAAALFASGDPVCRQIIGGGARAAFCLMGVCFDCLIEIDGIGDCQACLIEVRDGMAIRRQRAPQPAA
jgi:hypothetical protein